MARVVKKNTQAMVQVVYLVDVKHMKNIYQVGAQQIGISTFQGEYLDEMPIHPGDKRSFEIGAKMAISTGEPFHWFCRYTDTRGVPRGFQTINIPQGNDKIMGLAWEVTNHVNDKLMESFQDQVADMFWGVQKRPISCFRALAEVISITGDSLIVYFKNEGYAAAFNKVAESHAIPLLGNKVVGAVLGFDRQPQIA